MKNFFIGLIFLTAFAITITTVISRGFRVSEIPNGNVNNCANCHVNPSGGGTRDNFGKLVGQKFLTEQSSAGHVMWGPLLASLDADNDGVTNGEELQDPFGIWSTGDPNPGSSALVTKPGDASSNPLTTLTVSFSGMDPHAGQMLGLRVFDRTTMKEVGRTTVSSITSSFDVMLDVILQGHSYYIDFFADHNGNNLYDMPPVDHAWRIELNNAQGNDVVNFSHNTNFTDIDWKYLLTINFTGMTPHVGQLFELSVEDNLTSEEVARKRLEFIPGSGFSISVPGLELGKEYKVEMYADHNGNGLYDSPPTDHAWKIQFENNTGDVQLDFAHNTEFTDIGWKYNYTLNFSGMNPHVGQMLEMRIVRNDNGEEIGRTKVDAIPGPDFSVSIPQIELNHDYNVDFYADHNGNGSYDSPPTDHAWRLTFNSSTGNFVDNFSHNTNFVDINWPGATGILDDLAKLPNEYRLLQNYPNPFNPSTTITFSLKETGKVSLKIYNILGQEITTLINKVLPSGVHSVIFDADNLQSGTYIYRIVTKNYIESKKMVLLK